MIKLRVHSWLFESDLGPEFIVSDLTSNDTKNMWLMRIDNSDNLVYRAILPLEIYK
jgi:hypothetical protein